jgi:hypothetical protein
MKALKDNTHLLWLVALVSVIAAIAFYRFGFKIPVKAFNEEKMKSIEDRDSQEAPTPSKEDPPLESTFQSPWTIDLKLEQPKEPLYVSNNPRFFRVVFGEKGDHSMLGVLDETGGTGAGYNVAYVDENRNGDLTDEAVKVFPRYERGSRTGKLDPRVTFTGPFKNGESARYTLYIYSLARKTQRKVPGNDYSFHWFMDKNLWNYFFINGKMTLFSNAADALKGKPVRLGGQCQWEISARTRNGKPMISAGLKDENRCTLRSVRLARERQSPTLTLIQDGKVKTEEKMKFG